MARIAHFTETGMSWREMLGYLVRKSASLVPVADRRRERRELARLAQVSPHLLPDLGFTPDPLAEGEGARVWRKGLYVVTLETDAESGAVVVDVRCGA